MSLYDGTEASVRLCFRWSTLSNMNMSETSWQIVIKFHLEHHWGREFAELAIGPDQIRSLVSMAIDSSHGFIMGENLVTTLVLSFFFDWFFFILAGNEDSHKISNGLEIQQHLTRDL